MIETKGIDSSTTISKKIMYLCTYIKKLTVLQFTLMCSVFGVLLCTLASRLLYSGVFFQINICRMHCYLYFGEGAVPW